jgi:hypothetical protein
MSESFIAGNKNSGLSTAPIIKKNWPLISILLAGLKT